MVQEVRKIFAQTFRVTRAQVKDRREHFTRDTTYEVFHCKVDSSNDYKIFAIHEPQHKLSSDPVPDWTKCELYLLYLYRCSNRLRALSENTGIPQTCSNMPL
jgi:hypothetical protein